MSFRWRPTSSQIRIDRAIAVEVASPKGSIIDEEYIKAVAATEVPSLVVDGRDSATTGGDQHVDADGWITNSIEDIEDARTQAQDDDMILDGGAA